jgi:hypothetical protein
MDSPRFGNTSIPPIERELIKSPQPHKGLRVQQTCRLPVDLHRAAVGKASQARWSLNEVVCEALRQYVATPTSEIGVTHARTYQDASE